MCRFSLNMNARVASVSLYSAEERWISSLCFFFFYTLKSKLFCNPANREQRKCTFLFIAIRLNESETNLALARSLKSVRIPADARASISIATGYYSIRSKSDSWRLLHNLWLFFFLDAKTRGAQTLSPTSIR